MLVVTDSAADRLVEKLTKKQAGDDDAIRFVRGRQRWKLMLDEPRPSDVLFTHDGRTVLVLDPEVARRLSDRTLDVKHSPMDRGSISDKVYMLLDRAVSRTKGNRRKTVRKQDF